LCLEMADVDREAEAFLCNEDRLAARFSDEHLVEREERRAADLTLLQVIDALGRDRVVVDDDRLHPRARGRDDRRLVLGFDVGELGHGPVDALDRTGLAALEDRGDCGRVAALHVLRDVGLRLQLRILSGKAQDRGLQLGLLLGEPGLLRPPAMEVLLEFLEALARFLRGRVQFLELPVRVLMLDLVLFPGFLEQGDLGLEAGHCLLGSVPLQARARSIRRPSSLSLSCFASSPPRSAISCSSSLNRATAASRRPRSSSFWAASLALSPSCFAICSRVPTICRSISSRFLYASWAFAVVRRSFKSRYFSAPSRSDSSCLICLSISSRMIRIRSRFSSVSFRLPSAWLMSSSNFVIPAMLSRIR